MIKTKLPTEIILSRYRMQLTEWEVAKLDAAIAHETHVELSSPQEVLDKLATRVIEAEKAIRSLTAHMQALESESVLVNDN